MGVRLWVDDMIEKLYEMTDLGRIEGERYVQKIEHVWRL